MPTLKNKSPNSLHQRQLRESYQLARLGTFFAWTLLALTSCGGLAQVDGTDTSTNWYRSCDEDEQCGQELSCICGKCTLPCTTSAGCTQLTNAMCVSDEECESAPGLCVPEDASEAPVTTLGQYCTPDGLNSAALSGHTIGAIVVDTDATSCGSEVCLVNHVEGLPYCPYGQTEEELESLPLEQRCRIDDSTISTVPISPQHVERRAEDHIYCSCRCDGPEQDADYCTCPSGMECTHLVDDVGVLNGYAGSYCIKEGTEYDPDSRPTEVCDRELRNCGDY